MAQSEHRSAADYAPSAEEEKERVAKIGAETDLGSSNQDADPATAENPPSDIKAGDQKRDQT